MKYEILDHNRTEARALIGIQPPFYATIIVNEILIA